MGIGVQVNKNFFFGVAVGVGAVWAWHAFISPRVGKNGK